MIITFRQQCKESCQAFNIPTSLPPSSKVKESFLIMIIYSNSLSAFYRIITPGLSLQSNSRLKLTKYACWYHNISLILYSTIIVGILMDCSAMVVSGLARGQKPSFKRIKLGCAINVITKRQQKFL